MCKADYKVVLKEALYDDTSVDPGEIEVDGKTIDHIKLIVLNIVFENVLDLCLWYVFNSSMFYKLL